MANAGRGMPKGIRTVDLAHAALIWLNARQMPQAHLALIQAFIALIYE